MLKTNSKLITPGDTFVALRGINHDGHDYIKDAIERGATKIIAEYGLYEVDTFIVKNTHDYLVDELDRLYHEELKDLTLIGVTGTNGKTTVCSLFQQAAQQLGYSCAMIGTIGFYTNEFVRTLSNTTPDVLELYEMLLESKKSGCTYVIMEVSSHALSYQRIGKLLFDAVVFTNLTEDHLDFHQNMNDYALAKQQLFYHLKPQGKAIVNIDDAYKNYFLLSDNKNITYGMHKDKVDYWIHDIQIKSDKTEFVVNKQMYNMTLLGYYNVYNMTVVIILIELLLHTSLDTTNLLPPEGRLEIIQNQERMIIIDYAHTPDAVEKVLQTVRSFAIGKIITIIGCGGNRERKKRPLMGRIANSLSDQCIFTSDNPRDEDPMQILDDMTKDISLERVQIIENRKEAIKKGLQICKKNDILLILGKGHENYQQIGNVKYEFNDKKIVEEFI